MPGRCTYDYAIVRVVPRVERGEFVNVGAIISSDAENHLAAGFAVDEARLRALDPKIDLNAVHTALAAISAVCSGGLAAGILCAGFILARLYSNTTTQLVVKTIAFAFLIALFYGLIAFGGCLVLMKMYNG